MPKLKILKNSLALFTALTLPVSVSLTSATANELVWQTRLKLSVMQWFPMDGEFRELPALGGEFEISSQGDVLLPVLGAVEVGNEGPDVLAKDVAGRFKEKLGLIQDPEVRIEIVGQRPIYIVGMVEVPGETPFRSGMSVLQALALGGGPLRAEPGGQEDRIVLLSRVTILNDNLDSSLARIARLEAEADGRDEIVFPAELDANKEADLLSQEQKLFQFRVEGLQRQQTALDELKKLYQAEVGVLRSRIDNLDDRIEATKLSMDRVNTLLERGLSTVSQRTDIEILMGDLRSDRLDQVTAQMRAQQLISQADRDLTSLLDSRQSEVAEALLTERANLSRLRVEHQSVVRLLDEADRKLMASGTAPGSESQVRYTIIRLGEELPADETSILEPGDVVRVAVSAANQTMPSPQNEPLLAVQTGRQAQ